LGVQQLFTVFPLIERLGFVESFIALQPDQWNVQVEGGAFAQISLSNTSRPLNQDGFTKVVGEIEGRGNFLTSSHFINCPCPFK
jgi:hypothetical protein